MIVLTGQGLLELHINQAKNLVAADSNGKLNLFCLGIKESIDSNIAFH